MLIVLSIHSNMILVSSILQYVTYSFAGLANMSFRSHTVQPHITLKFVLIHIPLKISSFRLGEQPVAAIRRVSAPAYAFLFEADGSPVPTPPWTLTSHMFTVTIGSSLGMCPRIISSHLRIILTGISGRRIQMFDNRPLNL